MTRISVLVVLGFFFACGSVQQSAPEPAPIDNATTAAAPTPPTSEPAAAADDALCCCTFGPDAAGPEDFPYVRKWDALASACLGGDIGTPPGQCIAWSWCGYQPGAEPTSLAQPADLGPPPSIPEFSCCCESFAGGQGFDVLDKDECGQQPQGACVAAEHCRRPARGGKLSTP